MDASLTNLLLGTALLSFTYFGANGIIELGGQLRNPGRVIPRAFAMAFTVVGIIYVCRSRGNGRECSACANRQRERSFNQRKPVHFVSRGETMYFVFCGAVLAIATTLNALFIVGTKSLLMMVEDGLLPRGLASTAKDSERLICFWVSSGFAALSAFSRAWTF